MTENMGNQEDEQYLVINKDQDMIDRKSYKGDDSFGRRMVDGEGYAGIDKYE